jgi:hypothetical protein
MRPSSVVSLIPTKAVKKAAAFSFCARWAELCRPAWLNQALAQAEVFFVQLQCLAGFLAASRPHPP